MNKKISMLLAAVLFNCVTGGMLAMAAGVSPAVGAAGMNAVAVLFGGTMPQGVLRAGVYKEIWTGELVKALRGLLEGTWLDGIPDSSSLVNNDIIHLVEVGVDPEVLINNTTYPIPLQALDDKDIAIELDKFQTKVTPITDDELYAISYDKMSRVKESHSNAINDAKFAKAAHALCAAKNTATTPVLVTTGERDADTGRLRLTPADLVRMKAAMDKLKVPADGSFVVEAILQDGTVFPHRGKIVFASPDYNASTGTNQLRASLDNVTKLVMDLAELDYLSSAGLRVLLSAQKQMNRKKGRMVVCHVCEPVMEVFDMTGFSDILTIEE